MSEKHLKVLVVEDEAVLRSAIAATLRATGVWEVIEASSGAEAVEISKRGVDIAIIDVLLGDMDGFDVCRALRGHQPSARAAIIQISGARTRIEDKVTGLMGGADVYLVKPVSAAELLASVQALARRIEGEGYLQRSYDEAIAAIGEIRRVGSLGEQTAQIVHNMRTPLSVVMLAAECLRSDPEENARYAETILRSANRLKDYVTSILAVASPAKSEVPAVIRSAIEEEIALRRLVGHLRSVDVRVEIAPDTPLSLASVSQFELCQLLSCLVSNALDSLRDYGNDNPHLIIAATSSDREVMISVSDNGMGMDEATAARLVSGIGGCFTTKRRDEQDSTGLSHGGYGLGMSYVRRVTSQTNGTLAIRSRPGEGATISLRWPIPKQ